MRDQKTSTFSAEQARKKRKIAKRGGVVKGTLPSGDVLVEYKNGTELLIRENGASQAVTKLEIAKLKPAR